jgi:hypothetical protein
MPMGIARPAMPWPPLTRRSPSTYRISMAIDPPPASSQASNPYTRWLRGQVAPEYGGGADPDAFIADWDRLERLVIDVYRRGEADGQDEAEWQWLRSALAGRHVAAALTPHWQGVLAGGQALAADPFLSLTAIPRAADLVDNRSAMQLLPAAREVLNRWLLTLGGGEAGGLG